MTDPSSITSPQVLPRERCPDMPGLAQDLYDLFVENVQDYGLFILDPEGNIVSWNAGLERLLGYTEPEIINKHYSILFTPEDIAGGTPARLMDNTLRRVKAPNEHWIVRKDGTLFWGECMMTALYDEAGSLRGFGKVTRDATQRKLDDERQALHYAVSHALIGTARPEETYDRILRTIGEGLGWDVGTLWRIDKERRVLRCHALWNNFKSDAGDFIDATKSVAFPLGVGLPGRVWATGEPLWLQDAVRDPNFPRGQEAAKAGLHTAFAFPVHSETTVHGVVEFYRRAVRPPDEDLLRTAAILGNQIGLFFELLETEESARKSEAQKTVMVETALYGFIAIDEEGRITEFNPAAERMFGYTRMEATGQDFTELLIAPNLRARQAPELKRLLAYGDGPTIGHQIEITAIRSDRTEFPIELTITRVPTDGPPTFAGHLRDITERRILEESREELRRQHQAHTDREALVTRIGDILRGPLDHMAMQTEVLAVLCDVLRADRCFVAQYDFKTQSTTIDSDWHRPGLSPVGGVYPNTRIPWNASEGPHVPDPHEETGMQSLQTESGKPAVTGIIPIQSPLIVPLREDGQPTGALIVAMAETPRTWTAEEVALVDYVATQTYPALEAARQLKRDHDIAVFLQEALMPVVPDTLPGLDLAHYYKAALAEASVGGDFSDAYPLEKTCSTLVLGDVSGKGLAAASQVSTVRNMLRCLLIHEPNLEDAVTQLNNIISDHDLLSGFATLFVGLYDIRDRTLAYVSCGHEPALLRRADGRIEELFPTGMAIGVWNGSPYRAEVVALSPGDALFLYTDGVPDAGPDRQHPLDYSGLRRIVEECGEPQNAQSFVSRIVGQVARYAESGFRDDVCVLAAIVTP